MRWPRAGIVVGVIGLVLLGAGWWLAATGAAGSKPRRTAQVTGLRPSSQLLRPLEQYLAQPARPRTLPLLPRARVPRVLVAPHGTTCPVAAGGFCSVKPCVVFAGQATASVVSASSQAVIRQRVGPGAPTCRGRPAPPRTLPVAGF